MERLRAKLQPRADEGAVDRPTGSASSRRPWGPSASSWSGADRHAQRRPSEERRPHHPPDADSLRDRFKGMVDILTFDIADVERYADIITKAATAVASSELTAAAAELQPIAGEIWMGRLTAAGRLGHDGSEAGNRVRNESLRAQVFIRDGFRCTYCGGRAVPRCILVAGEPDHTPRGVQHPQVRLADGRPSSRRTHPRQRRLGWAHILLSGPHRCGRGEHPARLSP